MYHTEPIEFIRRLAEIDDVVTLSAPPAHAFALQELLEDADYQQILLRKFNYPGKEALLEDLADWERFSRHCEDFFGSLSIYFSGSRRVLPSISPNTRTLFVHSGKCICECGGRYQVAQQGDVVIFPPNVNAGYISYGADCLAVCTLTDPHFFRRELIPRLPMNSTCSFSFFDIYTGRSDITEPVILPCRRQSGIFDFLSSAIIEEFSRPLYYHETLDSYLVLFFTALLRVYTQAYYSDHFARSENDKQMFDIKKYIYDHCETVTLAELAGIFHFKASYLSQYIKKISGHSFTDMVQKARMEKACILLQQSTLSVADIIHSVGYQNIGFFYRIFTEEYGISPSEYRRQHFGLSGGSLYSDSRLSPL